jgi:hypothetical protein
MDFEPAGRRYGIPAVGLPLARPYGGRIVGANGLFISTPCPRKLASDRLVQTTAGLLPVVGLDFRGPWQVGYASLARISPAGIATLPDGSHVRVSPARPGAPIRRTAGAWAPFSLPQRRVPWPDARRARVGDLLQPVPLDAPDAPAGIDPNPTTLSNPDGGAQDLISSALGLGGNRTVLGPAGTNAPLGPAQIDTGLPPLEDTWDDLKNSPLGQTLPKILPSWGQATTLLVCVLVAVGVWFLWPILSGLRHVGV